MRANHLCSWVLARPICDGSRACCARLGRCPCQPVRAICPVTTKHRMATPGSSRHHVVLLCPPSVFPCFRNSLCTPVGRRHHRPLRLQLYGSVRRATSAVRPVSPARTARPVQLLVLRYRQRPLNRQRNAASNARHGHLAVRRMAYGGGFQGRPTDCVQRTWS